jgi:hypothetical protein
VAETFKELQKDGFIELMDFEAILRANQCLLEKMLENDLQSLDQWIIPFEESTAVWWA